jgi:hypothetical protein
MPRFLLSESRRESDEAGSTGLIEKNGEKHANQVAS